MMRKCDDCGIGYDDTYRLTFCPHDRFQMNTMAVRGDGAEKLCHTVEELRDFMGEDAA